MNTIMMILDFLFPHIFDIDIQHELQHNGPNRVYIVVNNHLNVHLNAATTEESSQSSISSTSSSESDSSFMSACDNEMQSQECIEKHQDDDDSDEEEDNQNADNDLPLATKDTDEKK